MVTGLNMVGWFGIVMEQQRYEVCHADTLSEDAQNEFLEDCEEAAEFIGEFQPIVNHLVSKLRAHKNVGQWAEDE
jgi:hypothetical protein